MNILLASPSIVALILVLWYGVLVAKNRQLFLGVLCLGSVGILVGEIVYYLGGLSVFDKTTFYLLILYYLSAVVCCLSYLAATLQIAGFLNKWIFVALVCTGLLNVALLITPGAAISGIQAISYGFTRVAGPYYWVIQITLVLSMLASLGMLLFAMKKSDTWQVKRRATLLLVSSSCWVFGAVIVVLLMQLGFKINALVVVPITICIFIGVQIYTEYEQHIINLLSFIPRSPEQKLTKNTIRALLRYKSGDLQAAVNEFERGVILNMLDKCEGNKSLAAEKLGISRATLRRKLSDPEPAAEERIAPTSKQI